MPRLADILGVSIGTYIAIYGLLGSGRIYNDIDAPLREKERSVSPKPFSFNA